MNFYEENLDVRNVGFYTLCTFRPKERITINNSGSHNVFVRPHHQNAKLVVAAVNRSLYYKDLIALLVYDITNCESMLQRCDCCPSPDNLRIHISDILLENGTDNGNDIPHNQWENTDRTIINLSELDFQDFIDKIVEKLSKLPAHHCISKKTKTILQNG